MKGNYCKLSIVVAFEKKLSKIIDGLTSKPTVFVYDINLDNWKRQKEKNERITHDGSLCWKTKFEGGLERKNHIQFDVYLIMILYMFIKIVCNVWQSFPT